MVSSTQVISEFRASFAHSFCFLWLAFLAGRTPREITERQRIRSILGLPVAGCHLAGMREYGAHSSVSAASIAEAVWRI